jgi:hypothetical protein
MSKGMALKLTGGSPGDEHDIIQVRSNRIIPGWQKELYLDISKDLSLQVMANKDRIVPIFKRFNHHR